MTENNSTAEKHGKSGMSVNMSPKTSKNVNSKNNPLFSTVVIKERDGDKVALTDQHNPNESREAENLIKRH
jgi:hypothetical protein